MNWTKALSGIEKRLLQEPRLKSAARSRIMERLREDRIAPALGDGEVTTEFVADTQEIVVAFGQRDWTFDVNGKMSDCGTCL